MTYKKVLTNTSLLRITKKILYLFA